MSVEKNENKKFTRESGKKIEMQHNNEKYALLILQNLFVPITHF